MDIKKNPAGQDSPPAAGRFSDIYLSAAVQSRPAGLFYATGDSNGISYCIKKLRSKSEFESDRRGSNPRSRPWQGRALPTTPLSHIMTVPFQNSHYFTLFTVCCQSFFTKIPQQLFFLQLFFLQFYNLLLAD